MRDAMNRLAQFLGRRRRWVVAAWVVLIREDPRRCADSTRDAVSQIKQYCADAGRPRGLRYPFLTRYFSTRCSTGVRTTSAAMVTPVVMKAR